MAVISYLNTVINAFVVYVALEANDVELRVVLCYSLSSMSL